MTKEEALFSEVLVGLLEDGDNLQEYVKALEADLTRVYSLLHRAPSVQEYENALRLLKEQNGAIDGWAKKYEDEVEAHRQTKLRPTVAPPPDGLIEGITSWFHVDTADL